MPSESTILINWFHLLQYGFLEIYWEILGKNSAFPYVKGHVSNLNLVIMQVIQIKPSHHAGSYKNLSNCHTTSTNITVILI